MSTHLGDTMDDDNEGKIYCHHCNQYKHPRTRFRHLRKLSLELAAAEDNSAGTGTGTMDETASNLDSASNSDPNMDLETHLDNGLDNGNEGMELDNDATNGNFPDISNGNFFDFDAEDHLSDAPSTPRSWFNVGTPPPSPPSSPFQLSDDDISEDEDGFVNLTAEDYREYDRWYAEDSQTELDEMIVESLTEEDRDSIKMMAIRQFGHISQRNYERVRYSFWEKVRLLTLRRLGTRVAELSGIKPTYHDCCIGSCHAFLGKYAEETECSGCGEPRYDNKGRTRQTFQYIPITPRFQAFFNNPDLMKKLLYRHEYVHSEDAMDDYFDSDGYKDLCNQNIIVDGEDLGEKFFSGMYDIATSILSDGVQIFKEASTENSSC